jgi:8-oxo-dGTP pyrophosphatase MutT (NUDIX family)
MVMDDGKLVMLQILADDEAAARELAEKAGISVADLTLLALRYCLRAKGAAPFRELLAAGSIVPPGTPEFLPAEKESAKKTRS